MKTKDPSQIHFPETKMSRLFLVLLTFGSALIITALITGNYGLISIVFFPSGLLALLPDKLAEGVFGRGPAGTGFEGEVAGIPLVAALYVGLALAVILSRNQRIVRIMYFTFVIFLIANIAGCSVAG